MIAWLPRWTFQTRVMGLTVVVAFVSALSAASLVGWVAIHATVPRIVEARSEQIARGMKECLANPSAFSVSRDGLLVYAYDLHGVSRNPDAPPLEPELLAQVQAGTPVAHDIVLRRPVHGTAVFRQADSGPCALSRVAWTMRSETGAQLDRRMPVLLMIVWLIGIALAAWGVLGPSLRRLRRLEVAAQVIGDVESYQRAEDDTDDRIGSLGRALDGAHGRLVKARERDQQARHALERHLADVAHDIRTPLAALQLRLEALRNDPGSMDALVRGGLDDVAYLTSVVENLRMAARMRDGESMTTKVAWGQVVRRVRDRFRVLGGMHGMAVDATYPDQEVWAAFDPALAEQVLSNLVHNAIRYASRPDEQGLTFISLEVEGDEWELSVCDDGPGVADPMLPELGRRTFRGDEARSRAPSGTGLGLAIVHEACKAAGCSLTLGRSELGGLLVTVRGPLLPSGHGDPAN